MDLSSLDFVFLVVLRRIFQLRGIVSLDLSSSKNEERTAHGPTLSNLIFANNKIFTNSSENCAVTVCAANGMIENYRHIIPAIRHEIKN